jgi:Predicted membrane protein
MVLWIALFGMVCWGIAPIFAKLGLSNVNPVAGMVLRTMVASILVTGWVGFSGTADQLKGIPFSSWFLIGIEAVLATVVGDLAYYTAIKDGSVSVVSIIMSVAPLVTMVCSSIFLGEPLTVWRIVGAGYIIFGMILIM